MLRTTDIVMGVIMIATATVTYSIKHRAELKLGEVRKLEAEIKLEKDTIDLLKADWALLTQPVRLQKLMAAYQAELQLVPTESTALAQPSELPMLKKDVPPDAPGGDAVGGKIAELAGQPLPDAQAAADAQAEAEDGDSGAMAGAEAPAETDQVTTGSVQ